MREHRSDSEPEQQPEAEQQRDGKLLGTLLRR
jgi:hypothetical protein